MWEVDGLILVPASQNAIGGALVGENAPGKKKSNSAKDTAIGQDGPVPRGVTTIRSAARKRLRPPFGIEGQAHGNTHASAMQAPCGA